MNDDAKYIVFERNDAYPPTPIVFPPYLQHRDVANALRSFLGEPSSAGFVAMSKEGPGAWGESLSLALKADVGRDTILLRRILNR